MVKNDFGLIFWVHLLLILLYIATPFLITWYFIIFLVALFYVQNRLLKNCFLTNAQLKDRADVLEMERSFYVYYFKKMGLKNNLMWIKKYFSYTLAWLVFTFALIWQLLFYKTPFLF